MKRLTTATLLSITLLALLLLNVMNLQAEADDPNQQAMQTAAQLYQSGDYQLATQTYQGLVDQGYADATLFYNLGNAYFKNGDLGRAILNYRRAEALSPRDAAIQANLALSRAEAVDQLPTADNSLPAQLTAVNNRFTLNELALLALGLWVVTALMLVAAINVPKGQRLFQWAFVVALGLTLGGGLALGTRLLSERHHNPAVIVAPQVAVMDGPGEQYNTSFELHTGAEVQVIDTQGAWTKLALSGQTVQGWVASSDVTPLF